MVLYYFLCCFSSILALAIYLSVLVNMYKSTAHIIFIGYSNKFFLALYPHKSSLLLSNNSYRKLRKLKYLWFPIFFCCWGKKKTNVTKCSLVVQIDKTCSWYINIYLTTIVVLRLFANILPLTILIKQAQLGILFWKIFNIFKRFVCLCF